MILESIQVKDLTCLVLVAVPALLVLKTLLTYLLDPLGLKKYPAPSFLAATTQFWVLKETWLQRRSRSIHAQHQKLGNVIRIAPSLVVFNIPEAVPDIYGHAAARKLIKDTFYDKIAGHERDIVNVVDHGDHAQRRKYLSNSFALKTVTDMEPVIRENFQRLLNHVDTVVLSPDKTSPGATFDIRRWHRLESGVPDRPQSDFMSKILADRDGKERMIPFQQLMAESVVFMNAGSETTAAALSSTLYYLISNPKCLNKLRAEVDARLSSGYDEIVPYDAVKDLPYLRACIDEALRLRPPIAYALQRLVVSPEGATIAGNHVKQGTTVAVSPWTIHRNESLYKNPDEFDPERWFDPDQLANLRKYYIVFSQGPRQCLGRHIAIVELQILISTLTRRYNLALADEKKELEIYDRFNSNPGPLPIKVERRVFVE
ncbi:hypothetical protein ACHAPJ_003866 [Fusarium lateritium]